jgi:hypothetical protein
MFLSPFIDLGDPIEKFIGVPRSKPNEEAPSQEAVHQELEHMESSIVPAQSLKPRIISLSGNIRLKDHNGLEGCGIGIGSGTLDQSKAYFEVHVTQDDTFVVVGAVGVHPNSITNNFDTLKSVPNSIALQIPDPLKAGDVLGIVVDISDFPPKVAVFLNDGTTEIKSVSSIVRGDVWPAVEIVSGSVDVVFDRRELRYLTQAKLSRGIEAVMIARSII